MPRDGRVWNTDSELLPRSEPFRKMAGAAFVWSLCEHPAHWRSEAVPIVIDDDTARCLLYISSH